MPFETAHEKASERIGDRSSKIQSSRIRMRQKRCNVRKGATRTAQLAPMRAFTQSGLTTGKMPGQRVEKIYFVRIWNHSEGTGIFSKAARISSDIKTSRRGS